MRIFCIVSFLVFFVVPVSLFAQQGGGGGTTSSISTDFGSSFGGVENVSEQSVGTFIGGGRPSFGFVGNTEIYNAGSNRSASTARQNTAVRATAARSVTATAARRVTTPMARAGQLGANNQTIRSASSMDFDFVMPPSRLQPATVEVMLNRVQGLQGGQVAFSSSPQGTTAVLTGTVATNTERRVAEQFLLMEPGVNRVQNLLELR